MPEIMAGNICSLCAMVPDSVSGTRKKRTEILGVKNIKSKTIERILIALGMAEAKHKRKRVLRYRKNSTTEGA